MKQKHQQMKALNIEQIYPYSNCSVCQLLYLFSVACTCYPACIIHETLGCMFFNSSLLVLLCIHLSQISYWMGIYYSLLVTPSMV